MTVCAPPLSHGQSRSNCTLDGGHCRRKLALYSPGVCFPHDKRGSVAEEQGVDGFQQQSLAVNFPPLVAQELYQQGPVKAESIGLLHSAVVINVLRQIPIKLTISLLIRARTASSCLLLCSIVFKYSASRTF